VLQRRFLYQFGLRLQLFSVSSFWDSFRMFPAAGHWEVSGRDDVL
jgi:hypothetical protein